MVACCLATDPPPRHHGNAHKPHCYVLPGACVGTPGSIPLVTIKRKQNMEAVPVRTVVFLKSYTSKKQPAASDLGFRLQPATDLPHTEVKFLRENKGQLLGDWVKCARTVTVIEQCLRCNEFRT